MAWYAPGRPPCRLIFKFEGEDGILHTITDLKINCTDNKCYGGEPVIEYRCEAVYGGIRYGFKLIFYIMDNRWVMIV
jgi:hypothetical protein